MIRELYAKVEVLESASGSGSADLSDAEGTLPIANGGTGQTTATAAFGALAPTTTRGDLIRYGAASNERVALGTTNQVLSSDGTDAVWASLSSLLTFDVIRVRRAFTEAELEALGTTAITLVAAPGADKIVVPLWFSFELNIATGYSSTPTVGLRYGTDTNELLGTAMTFSWNLVNVYHKAYAASNTLAFQRTGGFDIRNQDLKVKASADPSNPGTGVATAVANLVYTIITVT